MQHHGAVAQVVLTDEAADMMQGNTYSVTKCNGVNLRFFV
jgi:hypothetical protein